MKYFFEIDIIASVKNVLSGKPQVTIDVNNVVPEEPVVPEIMEKKLPSANCGLCVGNDFR